MKYDFYLKRQRLTLEKLIELKNISSYNELHSYFKSISIVPPDENDVIELFKKEENNVEKRTVVKSSNQEGRISDQKSSKSKTNDSIGTGRSGTKQRIRKSTTQRKRKTTNSKVESVQPVSGSEDTK